MGLGRILFGAMSLQVLHFSAKLVPLCLQSLDFLSLLPVYASLALIFQ